MAEWIASVRRDIPLHLNRFFPRYKMTDREATSPELCFGWPVPPGIIWNMCVSAIAEVKGVIALS